MKTVTGKAKAWIAKHSFIGPQDLVKPDFNPAKLFFTAPIVDMTDQGWTLAGEAEITVNLVDEQTLIDNKVSALREELKTVRAEAHKKSVEIEDMISQLLAITYEPKNGES
jgi:hypothetical protein